MAYYTKRGDAYKLRVSVGYDIYGKQKEKSKTWRPDPSLSERQIEKELQRQLFLFEEECKSSYTIGSYKFEAFAKKWFRDYAEIKLKEQTIRGYHYLEPRIYDAIGHLYIDKITPMHLQQLVTELMNSNRNDTLGDKGKKISNKTVRLHLSLISAIFTYAVKMQVVTNNPCKSVTLPSLERKEKEIYSIEEAQLIIDLLANEKEENYKYTVFFTLALFTGFRRGELLGLEWKDIDFENSVISVSRAVYYTENKGYYTDTPKSKSSIRCLKLPDNVIDLLKKYKIYQNKQKEFFGEHWIETDRIFTRFDGGQIDLTTPTCFFREFCKRNNIRFLNVHSFRHLNASLLINSGVDIKTVQNCLGHSDATTTLNIYAHTFKMAQAKAMEAVASNITLKF